MPCRSLALRFPCSKEFVVGKRKRDWGNERGSERKRIVVCAMAEDSNESTQQERVLPTDSPLDFEKEAKAAQRDSRDQVSQDTSEDTAVEPPPRSVHGIKVDSRASYQVCRCACEADCWHSGSSPSPPSSPRHSCSPWITRWYVVDSEPPT